MGNPVDNTSSVLNARKDDIKSSTKISFDNTLVKSLDTLTTFDGVTFTSSEVGKCYLYVGNENGYVTNAVYKIIKDGNNYLPQLDNSLSPSNKVDKLNLGSTVNNSLVKITTNAQGQVTGTSIVAASDIPGLSGKQDTIDTNNKLSSDLVDDTNHDHKFVTQTQISQLSSLVTIVGDQNSGLIKAVNDLDSNKVDKLSYTLWTESIEPINQGIPLNMVLFKPRVFTNIQKIVIKSFSILLGEYDDMYSGDTYIKLLDSNNNVLSLSNGVKLTSGTEVTFEFDSLVGLDKDTQYKIGFYESKTGDTLARAGFKVDNSVQNNELYVRNSSSEFVTWRPITKFSYKDASIDNKLVKITVNPQGQVTSLSNVTDSDIPTLPQSKITNLETDLSSKQPTIDSTHKLSSDLVDDTNHTNKFVTSSDLTDLGNLKTTVGDSNSGLVKDVSDLQTAVGQVNTLLSSI